MIITTKSNPVGNVPYNFPMNSSLRHRRLRNILKIVISVASIDVPLNLES